MQYDRKITISAGSNRRAMTWQAQTMLISELWARLQAPARGTEPLAEYLNMKRPSRMTSRMWAALWQAHCPGPGAKPTM